MKIYRVHVCVGGGGMRAQVCNGDQMIQCSNRDLAIAWQMPMLLSQLQKCIVQRRVSPATCYVHCQHTNPWWRPETEMQEEG